MEEIAVSFNLIANYIMRIQISKPEISLIKNNEQNIANIHEINQSEVEVHTIEWLSKSKR